MKKAQPDDGIVEIDDELGISWIKLPPDRALGIFRGISPGIMDEQKFLPLKSRTRGDREKLGRAWMGQSPQGTVEVSLQTDCALQDHDHVSRNPYPMNGPFT